MTEKAIKTRWFESHSRLSADAAYLRNSQAVAFGLLEVYDALSPDQRPTIHGVLQDWIVSDDNRLRYDAAFLTSQRCIRAMRPAVEIGILRCENRDGPEAFYEAKKLRRILSELAPS